ncbi:MAG TPA: PQQ-binding-like beta-propeller repeat protein, partial [Gemmatales bacterium]|nr:PQQ-binding-like beta-propeller repeat protein [Gemmatales bacterium]
PASIDENFFGKKLRCANAGCRQTFRVQADGRVQMEAGRGDASPRTYDWNEAPESHQAQEGDWLSAPPPLPGQMPMANVVQPPVAAVLPSYGEYGTPVASVISQGGDDEDEEEEESSYTPGDYGYGRKKNKFLVILIGLLVLLLAAGGFGYWLVQQNARQAIESLKKNILDSVDKRRWEEALSGGAKYREAIKESGDKEIEFALAWADLQSKISPNRTTNRDEFRLALTKIEEFFKNRRGDTTHYPKYRKDFTESAFNLIKRGAEFVSSSPDQTLLDELGGLLKTAKEIGAAVGDQEQVKLWTSEAEKKLTDALVASNAITAKRTWMGRLEDVLAKENLGSIDNIQAEHSDLVKKHPTLSTDADILGKLSQLKEMEPGWVKYSTSNSAATTSKPSFGPSIRICPPVKTAEGVDDDSGIVLAMARGTLYGLSARTGKDRWALRVGQDIRELPPRIALGGEVPDVAFVITTEEAGQHYLSQMNLATGERTWSRRLASPCPAGALLISNNRLAVPLKETVAIVEAGSGKMTGFFTIAGYDISSQPAHDKARDRLYVPVDRGRIFVLDLAAKKCVGVIYTEHGSGQIKGAPLILDDLLVVCIATGSGAGSTRIRAYDISDKSSNPKFELIGSYDMPGHASTSPYLDGTETLGIVSDQGLLWLFGAGKPSAAGTSTSRGNTPFYPLTTAPMPLKIQANSELKKDQPRPRVQVAHVALNDWWVFTHDHLVRNVFDPFRGVMNPSPVGSLPLGSPLHRAELSPDSRLVVVVTQPKRQPQMLASGIDRTSGKILWQTQLGTEAGQDPVALADSVAMLDRGGAIFAVKASEVNSDSYWQVCGTWPALPLVAASHRLLVTPNGETLMSLSYDPVRARIILRKIEGSGMSNSVKKEFPHNSPPAGTAVVMDDGTTLVPCKDGNIYQFNYATGASNTLFSWRDPAAFSNAVGHLVMPSPNQLVASNGLNKVLRWDRNAQGVWKRNANDMELQNRVVTPLVSLSGNRVAAGDDAGNLHALALAALGTSKHWQVHGAITKGPFRVGADGVGCIVDGRKLWWITDPDEETGKTFESSEIASIIGEATQMGDDFLLAVLKRDAGLGMLASYLWVDVATGKLVHTESLPEGIAPSSGASPLGKDRAFAPLSDGTVRILVKPTATTASNP